MVAGFSVVPLDYGVSLAADVGKVFHLIRQSGVSHEHHAMGLNLEGDWDNVMVVIRTCRNTLVEALERVLPTIRIDGRKGTQDRLDKRVAYALVSERAVGSTYETG